MSAPIEIPGSRMLERSRNTCSKCGRSREIGRISTQKELHNVADEIEKKGLSLSPGNVQKTARLMSLQCKRCLKKLNDSDDQLDDSHSSMDDSDCEEPVDISDGSIKWRTTTELNSSLSVSQEYECILKATYCDEGFPKPSDVSRAVRIMNTSLEGSSTKQVTRI